MPTPNEIDPAILARACRGDRRAQEVFLRRYVGPLHALLRRSGFGAEADDLTQDLLAKLLRVLPEFDPQGPGTLTTWVFAVAHRWLIDQRRRRHLALAPLEEAAHVADPRPDLEQVVEGRQLAHALEGALAVLPDAQRRVFMLAQVHDQPLEAIASVEGVAVGTIKSRLHRARAQLAAALARFHPRGARDAQAG